MLPHAPGAMEGAVYGAPMPQFEQLDSNYIVWSGYCRAYLVSRDLWSVVKEARPEAANVSDDGADHAWDRKDALALAHIQMCVKPHLLPIVTTCKTSAEAWNKLEQLFLARSNARRMALMHELLSLKMHGGKSVITYVARVKALREELVAVGHPVDEHTLVLHLLAGLSEQYEVLRTVLENSVECLDLEDTTGKLLVVEQRGHAAYKGSSTSATAPGSSVAFLAARGQPTAPTKPKPKCWYCNKKGHLNRKCFIRIADEAKGVYNPDRRGVWRGRGEGGRVIGPNPSGGGRRPAGGQGGSGAAANVTAFSAVADADVVVKDLDGGWVVDSGATHRMARSRANFSTYTAAGKSDVRLANGDLITADGAGTATLSPGGGGSSQRIDLRMALHVPGLQSNLLSVPAVDRAGGAAVFLGGRCYLLPDGEGFSTSGLLIGAAVSASATEEGQYVVQEASRAAAASVAAAQSSAAAGLWHRRYMHLSLANLKKVAKMVNGVPEEVGRATEVLGSVCPPCAGGKLARARFPKSSSTNERMELVHTDVCGPMEESLGGCKYWVTVVEDKTNLVMAAPIKQKAKAGSEVQRMIKLLARLSGQPVKRVRHDGGGEYTTRGLHEFYEKEGIYPECSAPYTPQQNGKAERVNRTVKERIRASMLEAGAGAELWAEALMPAIYVMNRSPKEGMNVTPYEAFMGNTPGVSSMRVWGGRAWALKPPGQLRKLESRTELGRFVGYAAGGKAYRVHMDGSSRVLVRRDVAVDETLGSTPSQVGGWIGVDALGGGDGNNTGGSGPEGNAAASSPHSSS